MLQRALGHTVDSCGTSWGLALFLRVFTSIVVLGAFALLTGPVTATAQEPPGFPGNAKKPNLLLIVTDDQRPETLAVMGGTKANFDVDFPTGIVTTPNCCPSRASILSGRYAHSHGVKSNAQRPNFVDDEAQSLGPWLKQQGYYTALMGKYMNSYKAEEAVPPGWDEFYAFAWKADGNVMGNGDLYNNFGLKEKESGPSGGERVVSYPNEKYPAPYSTRLFGQFGSRFIRRAHDEAYNPDEKPWALVIFTNAPNRWYSVEPRYRDYPLPAWTQRPSYLEPDMTDKPHEILRSPFRMLTYGETFPAIREAQLRTLLSVDDMVDRVFDTVDEYEERENTWGIFSSDNGVAWGEHHLGQKQHAYEESIRVPFRMAVPGVGPRTVGGAIAANIDIAPTLLEAAGIRPPESIHGMSLKSLALGTGPACPCPRDVLIENWGGNNTSPLTWQGIRNRRWTYVSFPSGSKELYDLTKDPYQLDNVAKTYPRTVQVLHSRMEQESAR